MLKAALLMKSKLLPALRPAALQVFHAHLVVFLNVHLRFLAQGIHISGKRPALIALRVS